MRWSVIVAASIAGLLGSAAAPPAFAAAASNLDLSICGGDQKAETDRLIAACTAYIEAPPKHSEDLYDALNTRAGAWEAKGDIDKAIMDLDEAIRILPKNLIAYINRGTYRAAKGDLDGAIADYDSSIKVNPYVSVTMVLRGNLWRRKGDYVRALADYDRAIHLEDRLGIAWNAACLTRAIANRELDRALDQCNKVVGLSKSEAVVYVSRAFVRLRRGEFPAAIADADKAMSLDAKQAEALFIRGVAKLRSGQTAEGQADIKAAEALNSGVAEQYAGWGVKP